MRFRRGSMVIVASAILLACNVLARAGEPYGFDLVPNSTFYNGTWSVYGSDVVPSSTTHDFGMRTTYGWDAVPKAIHPHVDDYRRVLPAETVQQLTSALRREPLARSVVQPK